MEYGSDEAWQEIHDEMYRREQERPQSTIAGVDSKTKFFIGLFLAAIFIFYMMKRIDGKDALLFLAAGGVFYFIMTRKETPRGELTNLECMLRLWEQLEFLQKHPIGHIPQIPKGMIHLKPIGGKQWYEGQGFKRSYAVDIEDEEKGIVEIIFVEVDIINGDIITWKLQPEGVYGDEKKDVRLIPAPDLAMQKRREIFMDKSKWRK